MSSFIVNGPDLFSEVGVEPRTLADLLQWRARFQAERVAYTFLADGEAEEVSLTYGELHQRARLVAQRLGSLAAPGERALLLYPSDLEYVVAFFGCLYAGVIAVPAYPPRLNRTLHRLEAVVADSQATVALSVSSIRARVEPLTAQFPNFKALRWLTTDDLEGGADEGWRGPVVSGGDLAFLQYTSGSTGQPKGVMVSHDNLLHNEQLIRRAFGQTEESVVVGWLPLYHDMGLIGNVLQTLYVGARCVLMSPVAFLQSPARWLQAISRFGATTSGGPNFAYDLCVRKVSDEQRARLDLSSWRVAFSGAEPVRPETLERFAAVFGPCGFRPEAFHPCYGLAEATLFVSGKTLPGRPAVELFDAGELVKNRAAAPAGGSVEGKPLVSCGSSPLEQQLVVVNPESLGECGPGEVGEVWVSGRSVAGGYWNQPEATAHTFRARTAGGEGPFLRTGDLGFLRGGELFVTGRLKDLIIIRGLNHYPQDIERTAEQSHRALRPGCGAAFSVEVGGEERLVVVQEVERHAAATREIIDAIRQQVSEEHEVQVYAVALIRHGSIAKTSSGKIQRGACRLAFLEGTLKVEAEWREEVGGGEADATRAAGAAGAEDARGAETAEGWLRAALASLLRVDAADIDLRRPVTSYGLDSLMAVELSHAIEARFGVALPLSSLLEGLSISELCARLPRAAAPPADAPPEAGPAVGREDAAGQPLSSSQQSLWFLHQLAPGDPTYNLAFAARIRGGLDVDCLRLAFQDLVDRHASLRTTFSVGADGEPVQTVQEGARVHFEEHDAARCDETSLKGRMCEEARRPFDLEAGPLLKVNLYARGGAEYVLLLTAHHIVVDFWSLTVLMNELGAVYGARRAGVGAELPAPTRQHADYVRWQAELLRSEAGEGHRAYWEQQLTGRLAPLQLPTDRPRPPVQTYRGASHRFHLGPQLTQRLKALSRAHGATLYVTLLAAFQVLLHRYTGQEEILVGSPTSGRSRGWLAGLVGYLVNPVVLRAELSGGQTFEGFLRQVRRTVLAAFEHQDYPFALLVQHLQPERDASRSPLFQVMFALQKSHLRDGQGVAGFAVGDESARIPLGDVVLESVPLDQRAAHHDLSLVMCEAHDRLLASLEYNTDLFDAETVGRMSRHFEVLLEGVVADAAACLSDLPILPEDERRQILYEWNETGRPGWRADCVHHLFERRAAERPAATALRHAARSLSYAELDALSSALARRLRARGVGPESVVGVCACRSFGFVAGALGVLKAGGAYLPLDPGQPAERLRFMLADSGARLLLTQRAHAHKFDGAGAEVVYLDELFAPEADAGVEVSAAESGGEWEPVEVAPDNLAYVIYTSGSTGRPKGVGVTHAALSNLASWHAEAFAVTASDRATLLASVGFDASVWELWPYLSRGASVEIVGDEVRSSPERLREWLAGRGVTVSFVPTPVAEPLAALGWGGEKRPALRLLLTGGDKLHAGPAAGLPFQLVNNYGPTENAVVSTSGVVEAGGAGGAGRAPSLGRPIGNVRAYILDGRGRPVPVGVAGELYVGGRGLARGYVNRPGLTAEKFIPHPFSAEPGARLYRTGDLARFLADGQIEFLGRADSQVKVRGHRIELGEVEAVLAGLPGVRQAAVVARAVGSDEDVRLAAYVVCEAGAGEAAELRRAAGELLPDYMVPAFFVALDELPLTRNGKVDLNALPAPDFDSLEREGALTAPRTQVEEVLTGIWTEVLGVGQVGINDNFFDLGGHSLLATRIISQVREKLNVEIPISKLFESPTVARLAESIGQALGEGEGAVFTPIAPAPRDEPLPLSFAQQRLWFFDQMEPGSAFYNIPVVVRLSGELNAPALERSFGEIVNRHEALRTRFEVVEGQPAQIITPALSWSLPVVDLRELPEEEREREVERRAAEEAETPFDLSVGGLLRTTLLQLSEREHVLLLNMHHIVSDAWSVGVLIRELTAFYEAFDGGGPASLPALPVQYADFARWQQQWLRGEALASQLAYWKQQLAGAPPLLELPTDRPRPAVQTFRGEEQTLVLPQELTAALKALSRREGATLYMTLLAAFKTLLYRYTGQTDIVVGTPIAGRNRADIEHLIGFFVNTQAIRTQPDGELSFGRMLAQVRTAVLEAHARQDLPFEKLVEELQPERSLSHAPIFQVMFALQNVPMPPLELRGLTATPLGAAGKTSKFDFSLSLEEKAGGLVGRLEYNTDLFDAATMARLLGHYRRLLEDVAGGADARLGDLQLLTEDESRQLLVEWNDTRRPGWNPYCVHHLFERRAAERPSAPALRHAARSLSYAELDALSSALARRLRALGVGPESVVGVCACRSFGFVAGALGVLKAGGAYLPLDPGQPAERLRFMLADSGARVVLAGGATAPKLAGADASLISLDEVWGAEADEPGEAVGDNAAEVEPGHLAYVIYTSGSTGRPKGVGVTHAALSNLASWHAEAFAVTASDRATLLASVGFDASVWELWPYLSRGASVDIVGDEVRSSPERLREWLAGRGVTVSFVPTPVAEPLTALEWGGEKRPALRLLLTGGDKLHAGPAAGLPFALVNNYGPTENAVVSTSGVVAPAEGAAGRAPSLGRPIGNVRAYILDGRGRPVPVGVAGELYVGGESLARGYVGRAALTAERFVPDPFSAEPGGRLYRTGDLARFLPDGEIEFLGRIGSQVKVRGHRIELGEVETALREVGGVREAVVECREERAGGSCLVAYVVFDKDGGAAKGAELRGALREKLPEYMVPAFFVALDELPLTQNGKVDRRALPAPPRPEEDEADAPAALTPAEELVSNIWAEVLGLRRVGVRDNFFELGGHSLLATQVVSRVRESFGVELPLRALFESPTVGELAVSVERAVQDAAGAASPPIERVGRDADLPLSFAQQRLWFLDQLAPGNTAYNIQVSVRLTGALDWAALEQTLNEIVRRHEALRTTFAARGGLPAQVIAPEFALTLPLVDVSGAPAHEREAAVRRRYAEEGAHPFDLRRLPLLRPCLLKLDETQHVLLLTMHHIVSDGWSMGVLVREVAALYEAFTGGRPSPLAELGVQYADYAVWQREWLRGEVLDGQLAYWKRQLGHGLTALELPTDRPRPAVQSFRGERRLFTLEAGLARSLAALSRREGVTLYMLMLAAFKALLQRYSGQDDIVVGTDIANRNRGETEGLIGFFVNQLVLRTDLSGNPTFRELLGRVRETALGAYAHQDTPFERLVDELRPERDLSRNPLFQVMFIFQNNPMPALRMGDLAVEQLELSEGTTAFDISLALSQAAGGGLSGSVRYSTDLFDAATIERMIGHYEKVLRSVVADGETRLSSLEIYTEAEKRQKAVEKQERKESQLKKLMGTRPKAVKLSGRTILKETRLDGMSLPLVMQPQLEGVDLVGWAGQNRALIEDRLRHYGAILFRGFEASSLGTFERFAEALSPGLMAYGERSSPRHALHGHVYTSTDHPPDQHILLHNEQSYTLNWPMKIWFFCVRPASEGGRTPIADSRRVYARLPAPLVARFERSQVMYVRNYGDMLGLPWQEAFQTDDRRAVEEHCRRASIEFEWKGGDRLRTRQVRPAARTHPRTGEAVWFNHAFFFNVSSLEEPAREALRAGLGEMDLPFNTFYGDGSPIEPSVIEQIRETYRQEQVAFTWEAGDILMLDNMLVAHGREPFSGPRKIAVAMGEPYSPARGD